MGHTNSTANLALPQFIGTDKPTWLSDVNGAFAAIDAYAGNNDAALAITDAKADTAISDSASAVNTATNAANTAGTASTQATNAVTVAGNALTVANGINSKVGVLTDLTTTDKSTIVNAINEVNAAVGTVPTAAQVSYDNTGSGLTATNVQDAIDEVAQGGGGGSTAWTQIGQQTGAVSIAYDASQYNEILISVDDGSNNVYLSVVIPTPMVSATTKTYAGGYDSGSFTAVASADVTNASVVVSSCKTNGVDKISSAITTLFGR